MKKILIFKGTASEVVAQIQNLKKEYGNKTIKEILEVSKCQ